MISDFVTDPRFDGYGNAAMGHGIHSALGVPIPLDGFAAAGLNLYAPPRGDKAPSGAAPQALPAHNKQRGRAN